jgi:hypothetical protein
MRSILLALAIIVALSTGAQTSQKGLKVDNKGMDAKNAKGGGLAVHKQQVAAKSSTGKGVEANKKGLDVKGSKGGMKIEKKKLEIKSKNVNIHLGK